MIQILNNASELATLTWLLSWWWSQRWWCCRWCDRCAFSSIHSAHTHSSLFFVRYPCNNRLSISQQILSNTDANKEIKDLPLHDMGCWCWCSHPYFNSHGARKSIVYGNQFQFDEIIIFYTVRNGNLIFSGGVLSSMLSTPSLLLCVAHPITLLSPHDGFYLWGELFVYVAIATPSMALSTLRFSSVQTFHTTELRTRTLEYIHLGHVTQPELYR